MSKRINVNPDHYKTAGRERPGDGVDHSRKPVETAAEERKRWEKRQKGKTGRQK